MSPNMYKGGKVKKVEITIGEDYVEIEERVGEVMEGDDEVEITTIENIDEISMVHDLGNKIEGVYE